MYEWIFNFFITLRSEISSIHTHIKMCVCVCEYVFKPTEAHTKKIEKYRTYSNCWE